MLSSQLSAKGGTRFRLDGELSFATVPYLWKQSQQLFVIQAEQGLEIDLGGVQHFDSAGLALLVAWGRWAYRHGIAIRFTQMSEKLDTVVKINHLEDLISVAQRPPSPRPLRSTKKRSVRR